MKIKGKFVRRNIAGDIVIVPVGETALKYNGMITTNKTGAVLWEALEDDSDMDSLVNLLIDRFEVDQETAKTDVKVFLDRLRKAEILEE